jgi:malonyl-CoA O-methyltransferase
VRLAPAAILDAGCGTGDALAELALRYPSARRVALDIALPMLVHARAKGGERPTAMQRLLAPLLGRDASTAPAFVCGDLAALPFAARSFDLVWSNLALQWVSDLPRALAEMHRVLRPDGLVSFTTFGPDTLREVRAAFAGVDAHPHVSRFVDMHDIGDMLVGAGFADPVLHMETFTLAYAGAAPLLRDLKAIGATNATQGRPRGLMGRQRWARALAALERTRGAGADGRLSATFEVVYGHAWKAELRRTPEGHAIVRVERRPREGRR